MFKKSISAALVFLAALSLANADTVSNAASEKKPDMSYYDALVLGLVEGVTEYLPVSSTGHLVIANYFLGLDADEPLYDSHGNRFPTGKFDEESGLPLYYTMKQACNAYAVIIQIGAILAVAIIYWQSLMRMLMGLLGKDGGGLRLLRNLICAFMPAAVIGLLLHDFIEEKLFGILPVIFALAAGGVLMLVVQKRYDARSKSDSEDFDICDMTVMQSLMVGLLQCLALWPGTSRSMMTILGGYFAGLKPAKAAEFSFLLGLVTLSAASLFKIAKDGSAIAATLSIGPLALGLFVAFVSAALSVKWLVGFLNRRGLAAFSYYRFAVAAILLVIYMMS